MNNLYLASFEATHLSITQGYIKLELTVKAKDVEEATLLAKFIGHHHRWILASISTAEVARDKATN